MSQKYKRFVLFEHNLSLAKGEQNAIGEKIENISVLDGIKTSHFTDDLSTIIEPTYASQFHDAMIQTVGEPISLFIYQTIINGTKHEYLILCSNNYGLYYYGLNTQNPSFHAFNSIVLTSKPNFQTYVAGGENVLLISSPTDALWTWNGVGEPIEILDSPKISSMAVNIDRLFVTDSSLPYSVAYSQNRDPTTWAMSTGDIATIDFSDDLGEVIKVIALDNYIYVLRSYGINKIYSGKDSDAFSISKMYFSNGKINKNTICQLGDYIVFTTSCGIYVFDGLNTKKICSDLDDKVDYEHSIAVSQNGIYYLFGGKDINIRDRIFFVNIKNAQVTEVLTCHNAIYASCLFSDNFSCIVFSDYDLAKNAKYTKIICKKISNANNLVEFLYKTKTIKLAPEGANKTLKKLYVKTETDISVRIITDKNERVFDFQGGSQTQSVMVLEKCSSFCVAIYGDSGANISSLVIDYTYCEG